jgi:hypothetical protein
MTIAGVLATLAVQLRSLAVLTSECRDQATDGESSQYSCPVSRNVARFPVRIPVLRAPRADSADARRSRHR